MALLHGAQFIAGAHSSSSTRSAAARSVALAVLYGLAGLGLSISNLILLLRPATRQWVKQVSRPLPGLDRITSKGQNPSTPPSTCSRIESTYPLSKVKLRIGHGTA